MKKVFKNKALRVIIEEILQEKNYLISIQGQFISIIDAVKQFPTLTDNFIPN